MEKEEILEKSRLENFDGDERELAIKRKCRTIALTSAGFTAMIAIILHQRFNFDITFVNIVSVLFDIFIIVCCCVSTYKYAVNRNKYDLFSAIIDFLLILWCILS